MYPSRLAECGVNVYGQRATKVLAEVFDHQTGTAEGTEDIRERALTPRSCVWRWRIQTKVLPRDRVADLFTALAEDLVLEGHPELLQHSPGGGILFIRDS